MEEKRLSIFFLSRFCCDIVDRERVISKGIEIAIRHEFKKSGMKSAGNIEIETSFADPIGTSGPFLNSIAAQARLIPKSKKQRQLVENIFKRLRRRKEFTRGGKDRLTMDIHDDGGDKYISTIKFLGRHYNEATDYIF